MVLPYMVNDYAVVADLFIKTGVFDWVVGVRYGVWHPNHAM